MTIRTERRLLIVTFLAPALILFTVFVAVPGSRALVYSLQKWDGLSTPKWVGLDNFAALFNDSDLFVVALGHNLFLLLVGGSFILALSLGFAALLHQRIWGASVFRIVFFFPNVMAAVAVALLWVLLYSTTGFGLVNALLGRCAALLESVGLHGFPVDLPFPFLSSQYVIYAIVPMLVWALTGFYMVLFLAAMENIPESLYEAAILEGASGWSRFWHITLPLVREVVVVGVVFLVISVMKFFDAIWVIENQRPTMDSHVLATVLYQKVFTEYNVGYGSAVAVVLFLIVFVATLIVLRLSRKEAVEY